MDFGCILIGPPGSGKGTQADIIQTVFPNILHISAGDLLREQRLYDTPTARLVTELIDAGNFAPNDVTIQLMKEKILKFWNSYSGVLLDGFPRNLAQAQAFDLMVDRELPEIQIFVLYFDADEEVLVKRLPERLVCSKCKRSFHPIHRPLQNCLCNGAYLYHRDDDRPDVVQKRLEIYREMTAPLVDYYRENGVLFRVDANQPVEVVAEQVQNLIQTEMLSGIKNLPSRLVNRLG
jgi:adenylate kinase